MLVEGETNIFYYYFSIIQSLKFRIIFIAKSQIFLFFSIGIG